MEEKIGGVTKEKFTLGSLYESGQGRLAQDWQTAFEHFNSAANRMHQEAQWKIGILCESGTGNTRFEDKSVNSIRLAANSGLVAPVSMQSNI